MSTTAIKERPILFSGEMVKAILEGRKTQTRRVINPQPKMQQFVSFESAVPWMPVGGIHQDRWPNRYGTIGDRLWVRETFAPRHDVDYTTDPGKARGYCLYRADGGDAPDSGMHWHDYGDRWKPSIHMPRALSRITLEITGVRVERVQEISEADAIAEGIEQKGVDARGKPLWNVYGLESLDQVTSSPMWSYERLWDQINGPRGFGWDANPWVWIIEFKRIEAHP